MRQRTNSASPKTTILLDRLRAIQECLRENRRKMQELTVELAKNEVIFLRVISKAQEGP